MKLYFGNTTTTVTTILIFSLLGFIGYSVWHKADIQFWGRRSLFLAFFGLLIGCVGAALILVAGIATLFSKSQHAREIWFYVMSAGALLKIVTLEIARMVL